MDWDQRYSEPGYAYGTTPNDFLVSAEQYLPRGGEVLCLAEGEGRNAVYLAAQGHQVTAVDASSVGLNKAQKLAAEYGVTIDTQCADLSVYEPGQACWAGVVSVFCHLPAPARRTLHQKIVHCLRPGGVLLLEAYAPEQLAYGTGGPPVIELLADMAHLQEELTGLRWQRAWSGVREVVEGCYHTGKAAVIQMIGVKPA